MSRSRRRRSGRPKEPASANEAPRRRTESPSEQASPPAGGRRRRRRSGHSARPEVSALEQMAASSARARGLKMLPPDGTVLEEVISDMQAEYGLPSTPQEYRLVIRSLPAETGDGKPAKTQAPEADQLEADAELSTPRKTRPRRRRRRRGSAVTEVDPEGIQGPSEEQIEP